MRVRRWLPLVVVVAVVALALRACFGRRSEPEPEVVAADSTLAGVRAVTLWFASAQGESLSAEPRDLPEASDLHARLAALVAGLAQGPRQGGARTLPAGTALLHAYLDDAGLLTLDLSSPFRLGFHGGARAEELVLGSLVRTVSSNLPEARRVRIVCAGAPLATLGGHFPLDQPLDPEDWP